MRITDIHSRVVEIIKAKYPRMGVISIDKMEDIDSQRPCFKVDVEPIFSQPVMANYDENRVMILISYFPHKDYSRHSLRDKCENMYDELSQIFALNFMIKPVGGSVTSLLVSNKDYSEDLEGEYMTFTFDTEYYNSTPKGDPSLGLNTDPDITYTDDLDLMRILELEKE